MHPATFRPPFTFRNSDAAIRRFPFPFPADDFAYRLNLEPHNNPPAFDLDEHYLAECAERAYVLEKDPTRCQVLPHMAQAQWDTLELLMESLARDYPEHFTLTQTGDAWHWRNPSLNIDQHFTFGDPASLPCPPFEYITRQVQGDFTLMDQRDNTLFLDGGMLTQPAGWSLSFDLGMSFHELHAPVPVLLESGLFDRALAYLLQLPQGVAARRRNWSITVNPRLDTALESYPIWGPEKQTVTPENVGEIICLRVELQNLQRLPRSNAILFGIRTYLLRLEELVRVKPWAARLHRVLRGLPPDIAAYKGMLSYLETITDYLAPFDDGAPTSPCTAPDPLSP